VTLKSTVYPKISGFVSFIAVFWIVAERASSFAASQKNMASEGKTIEETQLLQYEEIRDKNKACLMFEGKIVTYYDTTSFVLNCKQLDIEDPEILNELVYLGKKEILEIPARIYRMIPAGKTFNRKDLYKVLYKKEFKSTDKISCEEIENKYITETGTRYFLVENCLKREFVSYGEMQTHNKNLSSIVSLTPEQMSLIKQGKDIIVKPTNETKIITKMDGGVEWSLLSRARKMDTLPSDTPEKLDAVSKQSTVKVLSSTVCKEFENKIVAFYSQIFWMEKCTLRIIEGEYSVQLQEKIQKIGGVADLTPEQMKVMQKGKKISEEDLLKKLKP
jgi:hypothetical protein